MRKHTRRALCCISHTLRLSSCWLVAQSTAAIQFCCCMFCNLRRHMRSTSHFGMRHIINRGSASSQLQETCQGYCSESTGRGGKETLTQGNESYSQSQLPERRKGDDYLYVCVSWYLDSYIKVLNSAVFSFNLNRLHTISCLGSEQFIHYSFSVFAPPGSGTDKERLSAILVSVWTHTHTHTHTHAQR